MVAVSWPLASKIRCLEVFNHKDLPLNRALAASTRMETDQTPEVSGEEVVDLEIRA
jgi:hypothetical protein